MSAEKTIAVSIRVSPSVKQQLEAAAARENGSQTDMVETLLFVYAEQRGLDVAHAPIPEKKARAK